MMESSLGSWSLGEESLQMWDLNKRLEAYLARVKYLEEENEVLKAEIQTLKVSPGESSWQGQYQDQLAALRAALEQAFREKCAAELARDALREEAQRVTGRCQKERAAREAAKKLLSLSRQELEEEKRAQLWLKERAAQLQREAEALLEAHQAEMAGLDQEAAGFCSSLEGFRADPVGFQPVEVEDYAKRLASVWKGAVETYKAEVSQLEVSLCEARENLCKATEGNRQKHLQRQQLEKELASLKIRKEILEESLSQQWQQQHGEAEKLQLAVESLEEEQRSLQVQIAQVLEDRQQLMHLKMSLSLEVATYRTLLEAESTRLQMPISDFRADTKDGNLEARHVKGQAASLDKGRPGSRGLRPCSVALLKASAITPLPKSSKDSIAVASVALRSRSPVAREFQKVNTVLQSQSAKGLDVALPRKDFPASTGSLSFRLGSSQLTKVEKEMSINVVSQSFLQKPPPHFNSTCPEVPDAPEMFISNTEQECQEEEGSRDGRAAETEAEKTEKEEEPHEVEQAEEEEKEKQANEEPPGKATTQNVPYPCQLVTEALGFALKELNGAETYLESNLFNVDETQNGMPSDDSLSTEEDAAASSVGFLEEATQKASREQAEDIPSAGQEAARCPEELAKANDGPKSCTELQEQEPWTQLSQGEETTSPHKKEMLEEESKLDESVTVTPVSVETGSSKDTSPLSLNEGNSDQAHTSQDAGPGDDPKEVSECIELITHPDEDATAGSRREMGSWELETSQDGDHSGAIGRYLEEADGGAEDLEVVSTEALHLSEDEERRELWSPPKEKEEYGFKTESLEREFQQTEGLTIENLSPITPVPLPKESCHDYTVLGVQQDKPKEKEVLLSKVDILPAEEGKESDLEREAFNVEESISREDSEASDKANALIDDSRVLESQTAEEEFEEKPEDILKHKEDNGLRNEDIIEEKVFLAMKIDEITCEPDVSLQDENVMEEDTSAQNVAEEAQMLAGETVYNNEDIPVAFLEIDGGIQKGSYLVTKTEAVEIQSEDTMEVVGNDDDTHALQDQENAAHFRSDGFQEGEQQMITGTEEAFELQDSTHSGERQTHDNTRELGLPSEEQGDTIQAVQGDHLAETNSDQAKCGYLESEELLENLETSPSATSETDGISGTQIILGETLPDHTPLHVFGGQMLAVSEKSESLLPASQEATETTILIKDSFVLLAETKEQGSSHSPLTKENDQDQEGILEESDSTKESAAYQHSGEPVPLKVLEQIEAPEGSENCVELHTLEAEGPRVEGGFADSQEEPGETSQQENEPRENLEHMGLHYDEDTERNFVWEPEKDDVFQVAQFDPSLTEEDTSIVNDSPQAFSSQGSTDAESAHKVSPLTSVSDLGEIVHEGEETPGDQRGTAESEMLASRGGEESPLHVPECPQMSDMEHEGTEDHFQQEVLANDNPIDKDFPLPSSESASSASDTNMKGTDILEIVEQALEFNQELIKAAAKGSESQVAARGEVEHPSPDGGDRNTPVQATHANASQLSPETKDPAKSNHLTAENSANGLQQDFTEEILNGIGPLESGDVVEDISTSPEDVIRDVTDSKQLQREALDNASQSLPQTLSKEEMPIAQEEAHLEVYHKVLVDYTRMEALDADESLIAELMQTACMKGGKGGVPEAVPLPPEAEDNAAHAELSQCLRFQPEDMQSLQASQDN